MLLPQVVLDKDDSSVARSSALLQLEQGLDRGEVSAVKTQVLRVIIKFAKNNMVDPKPLQFFLSDFVVCNSIFSQVNLTDLLFLEHIINQVAIIRDDASELKKVLLPMVENYIRPLKERKSREKLNFFSHDMRSKGGKLSGLQVVDPILTLKIK